MTVRFLLIASAIGIGIPGASGSKPGSLSCEVVVPASDSGSGRLWHVGVGPGRALAWTDGRPGQVLLRDASGATHVIGRTGAGPGEFTRISTLGWVGDTLWVHDASTSRVQYFRADGSYLRGTRLPPRATFAPRPGGRFVGFAFQLVAPVPLPIAWLGARADATVADTLATFERVNGDPVLLPARGREVPNAHPLLARTVIAASPSHDRACAAIPAAADATTLRCVDDRGRTILERRLQLPPRPTTGAIYDSVIALFSRSPERTPAMMRDRISRPHTLPQVTDIRVGSDGQVWLQRSHSVERESHWTRLLADGSVRDSLRVPPSTRVIIVRGDVVWAAIADENDLESLAACRVVN